MPASNIKAIAKQSGHPISKIEKYWEKAKDLALEAGFERDSDGYWPYVMGITKKMAGIREMKLAERILGLVENKLKKLVKDFKVGQKFKTTDEFDDSTTFEKVKINGKIYYSPIEADSKAMRGQIQAGTSFSEDEMMGLLNNEEKVEKV
jgi:hypothetical protein